jgi:hypothetical protein
VWSSAASLKQLKKRENQQWRQQKVQSEKTVDGQLHTLLGQSHTLLSQDEKVEEHLKQELKQ